MKVSGQFVEEFERNGDRLDAGVLLMLEVDARLKEDDALVLLRKHLHERLHKVLRAVTLSARVEKTRSTRVRRTLISSQVSSSASRELK